MNDGKILDWTSCSLIQRGKHSQINGVYFTDWVFFLYLTYTLMILDIIKSNSWHSSLYFWQRSFPLSLFSLWLLNDLFKVEFANSLTFLLFCSHLLPFFNVKHRESVNDHVRSWVLWNFVDHIVLRFRVVNSMVHSREVNSLLTFERHHLWTLGYAHMATCASCTSF